MDLPAHRLQLLAELLERHAAALELYAAQWTTAPADSVQEAFIRLADALQQARDVPQNPVAWLYQVVRNQSRNAARAQRRREHHERIAARLTVSQPCCPFAANEKQPLLEALDCLPLFEREIVILRIWSGLTWQEIAELTHASSSSAQRYYVAALNQLRRQLESSCLPNALFLNR